MRISNFIQGFGGKQPAVHSDGAQQHRASTDVLPKTRRRLFTKYVALFVAVVCVALLSNGIFDVFFYYREHKVALIRIQHEPDGHFPNGIPNPLLPECRAATADAVRAHGADFGVAWDGDFDRCFFFDADGRFIEGYYLVGLLAKALLARHPGGKIIHDPRLTWNTIEMVREAGGIPVLSKTGHAFIKERMRAENAIYGGEMSAHHYFRDFAYCDSGMIPWLLIADLISTSGLSLAEMVEDRMRAFPCSGQYRSMAR